uniref:Ig-like domain-containing protein n=1 Tax=Ascaris lumbricoides TaxID=6252 RepID=A0A0M3IKM3_ASCLU
MNLASANCSLRSDTGFGPLYSIDFVVLEKFSDTKLALKWLDPEGLNREKLEEKVNFILLASFVFPGLHIRASDFLWNYKERFAHLSQLSCGEFRFLFSLVADRRKVLNAFDADLASRLLSEMLSRGNCNLQSYSSWHPSTINLEWILASKHDSAQSGMVSQPKLIVIKEYDHNENAYFCVFSVVSEEKSFTHGTLVIESVQNGDGGHYTCKASNAAGDVDKIIRLSRHPTSPIAITTVTETVIAGQPFSVYDPVFSAPLPQIVWHLDSRPIAEGDPDIHLSDDKLRLHILRSRTTDAGSFKRIAGNPAGESSKTVH